MEINWNRRGTASSPAFVGGVLIDGKVATVDSNELTDLIKQAWRFFVESVVPLTPESDRRFIAVHLNFSAGTLRLSIGSPQSDERPNGTVSLIVGNFIAPWTDAANAASGDWGAFEKAIFPSQVAHSETILAIISGGTDTTETTHLPTQVRFSCVGTTKTLLAYIGKNGFSVKTSADLREATMGSAPRGTRLR